MCMYVHISCVECKKKYGTDTNEFDFFIKFDLV